MTQIANETTTPPESPAASSTRYGCHNKSRDFGPIKAQAGWTDEITIANYNDYGRYEETSELPNSRMPVMIDIPHTMSKDCRYDLSGTDPKCKGCRHRNTDSDEVVKP